MHWLIVIVIYTLYLKMGKKQLLDNVEKMRKDFNLFVLFTSPDLMMGQYVSFLLLIEFNSCSSYTLATIFIKINENLVKRLPFCDVIPDV